MAHSNLYSKSNTDIDGNFFFVLCESYQGSLGNNLGGSESSSS